MKKAALCILFCTAALTVFAAEEGSIFPRKDIKGDFAIYKLKSPGSYYYIGLCHYGDDKLIIRFYDPESKEEFNVISTLMLSGEGITFSRNLKIMKGKVDASPLSGSVFATVLEWANKWYGIRKEMAREKELELNGKQGYRFIYWVPVFQIYSIGSHSEVKLECTGILKDLHDSAFFDFKGLPDNPAASRVTIQKNGPFRPEYEGVQVPLDKNWKDEGGGRFSFKKALVSVETIRLSSYNLDSVDGLAALVMLGNEGLVLASASGIFENQGVYNVQKWIYKHETKDFSLNEVMLYPRNGDYVSLVSLSCPLPLYLKNKAYFDRILH